MLLEEMLLNFVLAELVIELVKVTRLSYNRGNRILRSQVTVGVTVFNVVPAACLPT